MYISVHFVSISNNQWNKYCTCYSYFPRDNTPKTILYNICDYDLLRIGIILKLTFSNVDQNYFNYTSYDMDILYVYIYELAKYNAVYSIYNAVYL